MQSSEQKRGWIQSVLAGVPGWLFLPCAGNSRPAFPGGPQEPVVFSDSLLGKWSLLCLSCTDEETEAARGLPHRRSHLSLQHSPVGYSWVTVMRGAVPLPRAQGQAEAGDTKHGGRALYFCAWSSLTWPCSQGLFAFPVLHQGTQSSCGLWLCSLQVDLPRG